MTSFSGYGHGYFIWFVARNCECERLALKVLLSYAGAIWPVDRPPNSEDLPRSLTDDHSFSDTRIQLTLPVNASGFTSYGEGMNNESSARKPVYEEN